MEITPFVSVEQVESGFRTLSADERSKCEALIKEASIMVEAAAPAAGYDEKGLAVCRMVRRAIGSIGGANEAPMGATQGSMSALGYSQSWTFSNGSAGELYLGKAERSLLGMSNRIGASNPYQEGCAHD